jgi:integrase/recombinase XerD
VGGRGGVRAGVDVATGPARFERGAIDSGSGLANATLQQRLVPVRLFFDYLIEEGLRESNPVGRGRYTPGRRFGGQQRGLVPRLTKLPWIPSEAEWLALLTVFREGKSANQEPVAGSTSTSCPPTVRVTRRSSG